MYSSTMYWMNRYGRHLGHWGKKDLSSQREDMWRELQKNKRKIGSPSRQYCASKLEETDQCLEQGEKTQNLWLLLKLVWNVGIEGLLLKKGVVQSKISLDCLLSKELVFWSKIWHYAVVIQNKLFNCPWQFTSQFRVLDLLIFKVLFRSGNAEFYSFHSPENSRFIPSRGEGT